MSANADALNEAAVAMSPRAAAHFVEARAQNYRRADHLFARLMVFQWVGGIVAALLLSPRTWVGAESSLHPHVIAACVLGGLITALPVYLASTRPGAASTRYSIAIAQMLMSSLFVHLSGGRIETHFHVFGSLAFLAFYRDWRVLLIGTVVAGLDHAVRGILWPQTIFGVLSASNWRTLEHVGWVIFEDIVLWISIRQGVAEMKQIAIRQASLETAEEDLQQAHDELETRVQERTAEIATMNAALLEENVHRQRAEDTLRASEERFQLVARATEDAVWDRDMITGSVSYSEWFGKHFGYGAAQLQSSDAVEVSRIHPDDRAGVLSSLDAFFAGHEQVWSAEYRYRCADGAFASVYDRAVVVRAPDGKPLRIVGSMMNITERKRTESALRRLAAIVESSDDAILSNDLNGHRHELESGCGEGLRLHRRGDGRNFDHEDNSSRLPRRRDPAHRED
jgi:PAS domain S-box-containing protein